MATMPHDFWNLRTKLFWFFFLLLYPLRIPWFTANFYLAIYLKTSLFNNQSGIHFICAKLFLGMQENVFFIIYKWDTSFFIFFLHFSSTDMNKLYNYNFMCAPAHTHIESDWIEVLCKICKHNYSPTYI